MNALYYLKQKKSIHKKRNNFIILLTKYYTGDIMKRGGVNICLITWDKKSEFSHSLLPGQA